jgi:hypothetical protein
MNDDEATLRARVRALLRSERLPASRPDRTWAGRASGRERCLICDHTVPAGQVVWEAEFRSPYGTITCFFHVPCFCVLETQWGSEREGPRCQSQRQSGSG